MKRIIRTFVERRLGHYIIAGGTAFVVEYGSFIALYYGVKLTAVWANTASFILGLITSFLLNKFWVFGHRSYDKQATHQLLLYGTIATLNLLITDVAIRLLVQVHVPAFIAKIVLVGLVACWNFMIFQKFIFTAKTADE